MTKHALLVAEGLDIARRGHQMCMFVMAYRLHLTGNKDVKKHLTNFIPAQIPDIQRKQKNNYS